MVQLVECGCSGVMRTTSHLKYRETYMLPFSVAVTMQGLPSCLMLEDSETNRFLLLPAATLPGRPESKVTSDTPPPLGSSRRGEERAGR